MLVPNSPIDAPRQPITMSIECLALKQEILGVNEVAEVLSLSIPTIRRMVARRDLPFIKTKRRILFKLADIKKYLNRLRIEAAQ